MKKILGIIMCVTLSLGFFSCSDSSDDGGSNLPSATAISADVESKNAEKGGSYTETRELDLSSNPLSDATVAKYKEGDDVTEFFRQSRVDASRAAADSEDKGLENFKAILKSITNIKIEFEITATTPSADCSVMITAIIPPEATKSKKPFVQLVTQVEVGSGAGKSSIAQIEGFSIPTENLKGLILKGNNGSDDDDDAVYYEFTEENGEIIVNEYYVHTEYRNEKPHATYKYNKITGELKEIVDSEHGDAMSSAMSSLGMSLHLVMIDNQYYIYNMVVSRSAGKDLDSTFSWSLDINETVKGENEKTGVSIPMAMVTGGMSVEIKTTSAGAFTGAMVSNAKFAYTSEFKNEMLKAMGLDMSNVPPQYKEIAEKEMAEAKKQMDEMYKDMSTSETSDITGVYVNNKGVLTVNGKTVSTSTGPDYDDESGKMLIKTKTDVDEFSNGKAFYDGTNLYFGESFEKVSKLPEVDPYSHYW
ncbi:hypothetical protein DYE50_10350 [Treponema ruminis]|uniref:Lipoprotein n=1 Tax=Treponema ruminis TaxID=744515 RepID=A0A7W8LM83_9SPIR|nr:hypothetical protein [Treponema ruminis]MBB5226128.1 hypothetical protein [Treponema ruminis]QSI02964.1 hypothetical protein DYE50_10350 [Treponema ruminis]